MHMVFPIQYKILPIILKETYNLPAHTLCRRYTLPSRVSFEIRITFCTSVCHGKVYAAAKCIPQRSIAAAKCKVP